MWLRGWFYFELLKERPAASHSSWVESQLCKQFFADCPYCVLHGKLEITEQILCLLVSVSVVKIQERSVMPIQSNIILQGFMETAGSSQACFFLSSCSFFLSSFHRRELHVFNQARACWRMWSHHSSKSSGKPVSNLWAIILLGIGFLITVVIPWLGAKGTFVQIEHTQALLFILQLLLSRFRNINFRMRGHFAVRQSVFNERWLTPSMHFLISLEATVQRTAVMYWWLRGSALHVVCPGMMLWRDSVHCVYTMFVINGLQLLYIALFALLCGKKCFTKPLIQPLTHTFAHQWAAIASNLGFRVLPRTIWPLTFGFIY